MLRPPPTQIGLNTRDLLWHADRHHSRQNRRASGYPSETTYPSTKAPASTANHHHTKLAYRFLRPPSGNRNAFTRGLDDAPISGEAVPQDSRLFWDGVLANAQLSSPSSRTLFAQPSFDSLESGDPSGNSFEDHVGSSPTLSVRAESEDEDNLAPNSRHGIEGISYSESYLSSESTHSSNAVEQESFDQRNSLEEAHQQPSSKRRLTLRNFYRKSCQGSSKDETSLDRYSSTHNDLDGSADQTPPHHRYWPRSSGTDLEPSAKLDAYRSRRGRRTDQSTFEVDTNVEEDMDALNPSSPISEPDDQSTPPLALPRSLEMVMRRSSGMPRSPLYISQAAASSSPEKRARSPTGSTDVAAAIDASFLARTPRRRRIYKPRNESYSFLASEASQVLEVIIPGDEDGDDGLPTLVGEPQEGTPSATPASSPPEQIGTYRGAPINSSPIRFPPLPGPFSATPRTVSFNLALSSSSPRNPFATSSVASTSSPVASSTPPTRTQARSPAIPTPNFHRSSAPPWPSTTPPPCLTLNYNPTPSPPPPMTPHRSMTVYNDSIPASSQPQTPVNLRTHGVVRPNLTAPAGLVGGRRRYRDATPTRRRWRGDSEQENASVEMEIERAMRRREEMGVGVAVAGALDVFGVGEGEGRLERTPPGEERRLGW
ncbi:hypothetical protein MMC08_000544 [Hypocenomyce scalaris]|nr:hypothetical protein [Hypocenomyce scalaris]